jgi:hypothetical protein
MKNFLFVLSAVIVNPPHAQARDGRAPLAPQNGVRDLTAITATMPRLEMCRKAKESRTWTLIYYAPWEVHHNFVHTGLPSENQNIALGAPLKLIPPKSPASSWSLLVLTGEPTLLQYYAQNFLGDPTSLPSPKFNVPRVEHRLFWNNRSRRQVLDIDLGTNKRPLHVSPYLSSNFYFILHL